MHIATAMPEYTKPVMKYRINMPHCDRVKTSLWPCCILYRILGRFTMFWPGWFLKWIAAWIVFIFLVSLSVLISWGNVLLLAHIMPGASFIGIFFGFIFFVFMLMHDGVPGEDDIEGLGPG